MSTCYLGYKFNNFNYQGVSKTLRVLYDSVSTLRLSFSVEQFFDISGLLTNKFEQVAVWSNKSTAEGEIEVQ